MGGNIAAGTSPERNSPRDTDLDERFTSLASEIRYGGPWCDLLRRFSRGVVVAGRRSDVAAVRRPYVRTLLFITKTT